jgi:hypothetical protein
MPKKKPNRATGTPQSAAMTAAAIPITSAAPAVVLMADPIAAP